MIIKSSSKGLSPSQLDNISGEMYVHRLYNNYMVFDIDGDYNNVYHVTNSQTYNSLLLFTTKSIYDTLKNTNEYCVITDIRNPHDTYTIMVIYPEIIGEFINEAFFNKFKIASENISQLKEIYENKDTSLFTVKTERPTTFLIKEKEIYSKLKMLS